jgi:DNA ligase-1
VIAFAALLDRLILTPSRNGKVRLLIDYFRAAPDPDRGYALAAVTGDLDIASVKPAMLRMLIAARMDEMLFALSYDYVGDLAETIALAWPAKRGANRSPTLSEFVETLQGASRAEGPRLVEGWLDALDESGRWALLKLVTGGLRIGVSARLAKTALAEFGGKDVNEIEELWHGLSPPYETLFKWLEGAGEKPAPDASAMFRPVMLAHPLEDADLAAITPEDFTAEWKWDGIRVQAVAEGGARRLYSRTGDDIGKAFPDIVAAMPDDAVIDGELLVFDPQAEGYSPMPFSELQKRLNRKTVAAALLQSRPAFVRAYDLLSHDGEDLRALPFAERRRRLEAVMSSAPPRFDLSPLVAFSTKEGLAALRANPPAEAIEGLMLKRKGSHYVPGRPKGEWWKWKRQPFLVDAVLMYAQRGHGKRSSFYSDYTFGLWTEDGALVPVGKAYFGFTDEELKEIDRFVRNNTTERFGPVRAVTATAEKGLVLEVAFEGLNRSTRHKSGVAMRFPRVSRLRWDKPPRDADRLAALEKVLGDGL